MKKQAMQFLYGDRELLLKVGDLLSASVEVIVNPANCGLSHGAGLAEQILQQAGDELQQQSEQLINEYGELESGMAVFTSAGRLPYKAVIHAVGPTMGEGDEQGKIQRAVARSLQLCEMNEWQSIAFPAISTGIFNVPIEICAQGFFRAITSFWDARLETAPSKIQICLNQEQFRHFFDAFREESIETDVIESGILQQSDSEPEAGYVDLSEQELDNLEDDEIDDWFK